MLSGAFCPPAPQQRQNCPLIGRRELPFHFLLGFFPSSSSLSAAASSQTLVTSDCVTFLFMMGFFAKSVSAAHRRGICRMSLWNIFRSRYFLWVKDSPPSGHILPVFLFVCSGPGTLHCDPNCCLQPPLPFISWLRSFKSKECHGFSQFMNWLKGVHGTKGERTWRQSRRLGRALQVLLGWQKQKKDEWRRPESLLVPFGAELCALVAVTGALR